VLITIVKLNFRLTLTLTVLTL